MSTIAMPTPTYVLIADLSSLVIRPPYIRSRLTLLNRRLAASVKTESDGRGLLIWTVSRVENASATVKPPKIYHRGHEKRRDHPQIKIRSLSRSNTKVCSTRINSLN